MTSFFVILDRRPVATSEESVRYHESDMNLKPHTCLRSRPRPLSLGLLILPFIWHTTALNGSEVDSYRTSVPGPMSSVALTNAQDQLETPPGPLLEAPEGAPLQFAEKVGLHFEIPAGASAREIRQGGRDVLMMLDESTPPKWSITFQRLDDGQVGETTSSRIDALLGGLEIRNDPATLLERKPLKVRVMGGTESQGFPAELIYLKVPLDGGRIGISGLLIIQTGLSNFLYGTLFAEGEDFETTLKPMLEGMYGDLRIEPENSRRELDSSRIASGAQLIELITPEVLREIATDTDPEIYRIYEKDETGTITEIGWQRLSTTLAPMSAVEGRSTTDDTTEEDLGLLVTLEGEIVSGFAQSKVTTDTIRRHWLSLDRSRERWSVQRTPRRIISNGTRRVESEVGTTQAETGVRTPPQPRSTITIINSEGLRNTLDVPQPPIPYMTPTELYILGRILDRVDLTDVVQADWYVLDRSVPRGDGIRKRQDQITPTAGAGWMVSTLGPSGTFTQEFDAEGSRLFRRTPIAGGDRVLILEKTDPNRLLQLYAELGIPTR